MRRGRGRIKAKNRLHSQSSVVFLQSSMTRSEGWSIQKRQVVLTAHNEHSIEVDRVLNERKRALLARVAFRKSAALPHNAQREEGIGDFGSSAVRIDGGGASTAWIHTSKYVI